MSSAHQARGAPRVSCWPFPIGCQRPGVTGHGDRSPTRSNHQWPQPQGELRAPIFGDCTQRSMADGFAWGRPSAGPPRPPSDGPLGCSGYREGGFVVPDRQGACTRVDPDRWTDSRRRLLLSSPVMTSGPTWVSNTPAPPQTLCGGPEGGECTDGRNRGSCPPPPPRPEARHDGPAPRAGPGRSHSGDLAALPLVCLGPTPARTGAPGLREATGQVGGQGHRWTLRSDSVWDGTLAQAEVGRPHGLCHQPPVLTGP